MRRDPNHIGAPHLYIHTLEASPHPDRAEAAADRLAKIDPEAGHLIHMPTHIHLRVGRYDDAERLNARAVTTTALPFDAVRQMQPMEFFRAPTYVTMVRFGRWNDVGRVGHGAPGRAVLTGTA